MLDQTTDLAGQLLHRLQQIVALPVFVKSASFSELQGDENLSPNAYACPGKRLFPCHSPAATWLSTGFFLQQKDGLQPDAAADIDKRLHKFAAYHNVTNAVETLRQKYADFTQLPEDERLDDSDYALVLKQGEQKKRYYPLRNSREVKQAGQYYLQYRDRLSYDMRRRFAAKLLEKAAQYGATLGEMEEPLLRASGQGAVSVQDAAELIYNRVQASRQGKPGRLGPIQTEMLKLAKMYLENPAKLRVPGILPQLAETVDQFDRHFKLTRYDEHFPRPEDGLFAVTKQAGERLLRDNVELTSGSLYRLEDLQVIKTATLRDALGDAYAEALSAAGENRINLEKAAEILPTLPRPDAQLFDVLCREHGISPWGKTAKANDYALDDAQLLELARTGRR